MRALILSFLVIWMAAPALAQWRTTKAHPVEKDSRDHVQIIEDFFFDNDGVADVQSNLSLPLTVIFDQFSSDLKKMALANFPEPLVEPYLETPGGEVFIPIFSEDIKDKNGNSTGGVVSPT